MHFMYLHQDNNQYIAVKVTLKGKKAEFHSERRMDIEQVESFLRGYVVKILLEAHHHSLAIFDFCPAVRSSSI